MTLVRAGIWVLVLLWPISVLGAPALVQSGEHENFTRLVTTVSEGATWSVEQIGKEVTLSIDGQVDGFETGQVFDRIPKDRVAAVSHTESKLQISLACDCRVAAFEARGRFAVIDIANAGTELAQEFIPDQGTRLAESKQRAPRPQALPSALGRTPISPMGATALADLQQKLSQEFGSAATQGILDTEQTVFARTRRRPQIEPSLLPKPRPVAPPRQVPDATSLIQVTTSRDLPSTLSGLTDTLMQNGLTCAPNSAVALHDWGDDRPFHQQISALRANLYDELDRLNEATAVSLAKTYLHFGFGAEARQTLLLVQSAMPADPVLLSIADIIDLGYSRTQDSMRQMVECDGGIALWALLALPKVDTSLSVDPAPALLALNKLPRNLRKVIAPLLADRLQQYGDENAASAALRTLERTKEPLPAAAQMVAAKINTSKGRNSEAKAGWKSVLGGNSDQSPEALIALIETSYANNTPISLEQTELALAYAKELRGTNLGEEMQRAYALSLVGNNQFDAAFEFLSIPTRAEKTRQEVYPRLISALISYASDVVFLDHILAQSDSDFIRLATEDLLAVSARLLSLGFAENAWEMISLVQEKPRNEVRQILAARIALELEQPFRAKAELIGIESAEALLIRAVADEMTGAHSSAYAGYRASSAPKDAMRAAWLAEEWQSEFLADDPVLGPTAGLDAVNLPDNNGLDGMLARAAGVLDESNSARTVLNAMLTAPEMQVSQTDEAE